MADDAKELKRLIEEYKALTKTRFTLFDPATKTTASEIAESIEVLKNHLSQIRQNSEDIGDSFSKLRKQLSDSVNDYSRIDGTTKDILKNYSKISDITRQLEYDEKDIYELNLKQLKTYKGRISSLKDDIKLKAEALLKEKQSKGILGDFNKLDKDRLKTKLKELQEQGKISKEHQSILQALKEEFPELNKILDRTGKRLKQEEKINRALGITGVLFKSISAFLQKIGVDSHYLDEINDKLREAAKTGNGFTVAGTAIKEIFKVIGKSLLDPIFMLGMMIKLFGVLKNMAFEFSARTFDIAKSFAITSDSALLLNQRFSEIVGSSNNILVTQKSLLQATKDINERYGTNAMLTQEILTGQIELTDKLGLQGAEAAAVTEYSLKTGKSQAQIVESITKQNKGILNNRKVLEATLKVGGQLYAQYKGDVEQIAKAVVQAQKLGLTLEETANISRNLLNFETSISAELEAELLTGQDLNLEKARYLALQGKSAEAAAELLKNLGPNGLNKFMNMNVLQQDALARSLGMTSDQLANSLRTQQAISKLSSQDRSAYKEAIRDAQAKGDYDRASALEKEMNQGKEFKMAQLNLDAQTKFNKAIVRMKALLASIVEGPLGSMAEKIASMVEGIAKIPGVKEVLKFAVPLLGLLTGGLFVASLSKGLLFPMKVIVMNPGGMGAPGAGYNPMMPLTPVGKAGVKFNPSLNRYVAGSRGNTMIKNSVAQRYLQRYAPQAASGAGMGMGMGMGSMLASLGGGMVGTLGGSYLGGGGTGANIGSMVGTGLGALLQGVGIPAPVGMALGGLAGGFIGGLFDDKPTPMQDGEISSNGLIAAKYSAGKIKPIAQGRKDDNIYFSTNKSTSNNNSATNALLTQLITESKLAREKTINVTVDNTPVVGTRPIIDSIKNTYKTGLV